MALNRISADSPASLSSQSRDRNVLWALPPLSPGTQRRLCTRTLTVLSLAVCGLLGPRLPPPAAPLKAEGVNIKAFLRETHLLPGKVVSSENRVSVWQSSQSLIVETIELLQCPENPPGDNYPQRGTGYAPGSDGADKATG